MISIADWRKQKKELENLKRDKQKVLDSKNTEKMVK